MKYTFTFRGPYDSIDAKFCVMEIEAKSLAEAWRKFWEAHPNANSVGCYNDFGWIATDESCKPE